MALRLYSGLVHAVRALAWPTLWWLGRKVPAYRARWDERRGHAPVPPAFRGGVLLHAASMGEVQAALPLLQALHAARPELPVVFTSMSPTASERIVQACGSTVHHAYLPFDTPGAVRRFLDAADPRLLVVLETELWPNLLTQAQARGTAVLLANGRLSIASARSYERFPRTTALLLAAVDRLLVQDDAARARFVALGAAPARVTVTGSLKVDTPLPPDHAAQVARCRAWVGTRDHWVAASTHEGEEAAVLEAVRLLAASGHTALAVLVPRHPQRFDAVAALLERSGLPWQRRSAAQPVRPATQVLLVDTMGELTAWMAEARAVFMGGTLVPVGGHNPLEAMQFGVPLLAGPHRHNFAEWFERLSGAEAVRPVTDAVGLAGALAHWLLGADAARAAGERGRRLHAESAGATARSLAPLLELIDRRATRVADDGGRIWRDPALLQAADATSFDPGRAEALAGAGGRGSVWQREIGSRAFVLRHYRRGGAVGRLLADRFLREGSKARSRAFAEFALLQRLVGWGLPVPAPAAARWQPAGPLHYRADLLMQRLDGAQDLGLTLQQRPLSMDEWQAVGGAIAAMHAHGVWHADLNCRNLMHDPGHPGRVWIIDFDRGRVRAPGPWRAENLVRLKRSFLKEQGRQATWHWGEADWTALRGGYDEVMRALEA